jgi:GT2 family glycosyltransferase
MQAAVVILNWNGKLFLEKFLPQVIRCSKNAEVIVADNHSTDDSVAFLQKHFPSVKIISNDSNLGFAGGYNEVLKRIDSEYYILLNSDVEVTENWIEPIIRVMNENQSVAAVQPKIRSYHQRDEFEYAGASGGYIDKYGYPFCRGRIFLSVEKDLGQYDDAREIFWATGACMFIRASVFHEVGRFDQEFFAHMEEIDLCWRIHKAGYKILCIPQSVVYHIGGGTLPKNNSRKTYLNFRNNLKMIDKNAVPQKLFSILLFRTFFDLVAAFLFLFRGSWKDCKAVITAHFHFHQNRKKKSISTQDSTADFDDLIFPKSILLDYFMAGHKKFSELGKYSQKKDE